MHIAGIHLQWTGLLEEAKNAYYDALLLFKI
jgi:hypothetical protein